MEQERHWSETTILISLDGLDSLFQAALLQQAPLQLARQKAQSYVSEDQIDANGFLTYLQKSHPSDPGGLFDLADNWISTDFTPSRVTDEIITIFYLVLLKNSEMRLFLSDQLGVQDILPSLIDLHDQASNQAVVDAVESFEADIAAENVSDWDKSIYLNHMDIDPFVDVSYPIYRGYVDRIRFASLQAQFSQSFKNTVELDKFISKFEKRFGKLQHRKVWMEMIQ